MIKIIYEDNHLLVVEKPVNVLSQADNTGDVDMLEILKAYIKEKYKKPGEVYLGLVHRLDRPVGGVMVFARTSKAASRLSEQIRVGEFKKTYLAIIEGILLQKAGIMEDWLLKNHQTNTVSKVEEGTNGAQKALLEYEVISEMDKLSLVKINLITGRPHQIRVQFATRGCPLYGDIKYNKNIKYNALSLWSYEISLTHPTLKDMRTFQIDVPEKHPWSLFKSNSI